MATNVQRVIGSIYWTMFIITNILVSSVGVGMAREGKVGPAGLVTLASLVRNTLIRRCNDHVFAILPFLYCTVCTHFLFYVFRSAGHKFCVSSSYRAMFASAGNGMCWPPPPSDLSIP